MTQKRIGLFWFTNDLRLHDQPALMRAVASVDQLVCVFVLEERWFSPRAFSVPTIGQPRLAFLMQGLVDLSAQLATLGHKLIIARGQVEPVLAQVLEATQCTDLFCSRHAGWYEQRSLQWLANKAPTIQQHVIDSSTLFDLDRLPFDLSELPKTFTQFRKRIEAQAPSRPLSPVSYLPPMPVGAERIGMSIESASFVSHGRFVGGEAEALKHVARYFTSNRPSSYKEVRNALDGWDNSTKLSPWLATGCLSVREAYAQLKDYENAKESNDSTYWIYFELLWREFFQWYAHRHGANVFKLKGVKDRAPLGSFYPERFQKWIAGNTPYPVVNAGMNELRETGYLSNRGRQIVASCFVNELAMDWRYGAAYFEQVLLDYDVASNWGNWQYLGGVGADPQPKRHFNLAKQTATFDPSGDYVKRWRGDQHVESLDSVDAADWPLA